VKQALLDGEVVILDEKGVSSFQALQNAMKLGTQQKLIYYVFDLLHLDGQDLMEMPLVRRKELLANVVKGGKVVRYTEHIEGRGAEVYREACERGLEGILSKKRESRYRPGCRSREWVKVKCLDRQEFAICGFTDPEGARSGFGALLLGTFGSKGELVYRGRVGTGFTGKSLSELHGRLTKLERTSPPFAKPPTGAMARGVHWIEPRLVAEVAFHGWTEDGIVRQAAFEGLREDKPAREAVREKAASEFAGVRLSNPDRVLYPEQGVTKSDLAKFYEEISDLILPHIVERPLSLLRCPEGYDKECFYQKHAVEATPRRLRRIMLKDADGKSKEQPHIYIEDAAGLIALVQMGVLEINPWGSRVGRLEHPDRMIFDLDPGPGAPWESVIAGARHLRDRLDGFGLRSFVKTTGGKGLHVVVPLDPAKGWDEVKEFARGLAEEMARAAPRYFTAVMNKTRRTGKVYVDYVRNSRGATAVADRKSVV
jgi:bifunctional non-homologous end joining protein LigD